jgi:hypothetical protein
LTTAAPSCGRSWLCRRWPARAQTAPAVGTACPSQAPAWPLLAAGAASAAISRPRAASPSVSARSQEEEGSTCK